MFGCARLQHLHTPSQRERLLRAVLDAGITRFDVAPSYGNGLDERALGRSLRGIRGEISVSTKVGIPVRIYPSISDRVFPLMRAMDVLAGSHGRAYATRDFDPHTLRTSIEASLCRLGISTLETYFLHEPRVPFSAIQWDELGAVMERLGEQGKLRSWGIAGPSKLYSLDKLRRTYSVVVQQPFSELVDSEKSASISRRVAYGSYAAYREAGCPGSFESFLVRAGDLYLDTSFIVSTLDPRRVSRWLS